MTEVASDEDGAAYLTSEVRFNALAGLDYEIAVDGFAGRRGAFTLEWEFQVTSDKIPVITAQPVSQTALFGSAPLFAVVATGTGLVYRWHLNGNRLTGETNAILALTRACPKTADIGEA